jgi:ClpP class serine protease
VDKLGGFDVALDTVKELTHSENQKVNVIYPEPKRKSIFEMLGQGAADSLMEGVLSRLHVDSLEQLQAPGAMRGLFFL